MVRCNMLQCSLVKPQRDAWIWPLKWRFEIDPGRSLGREKEGSARTDLGL
jgi:hypothetical protein